MTAQHIELTLINPRQADRLAVTLEDKGEHINKNGRLGSWRLIKYRVRGKDTIASTLICKIANIVQGPTP